MTDSWTVRCLLDWCVPWLESKGVGTARLDSELLLAESLGVDRIWLYGHPDELVSDLLRDSFKKLILRRAEREPVNRILGRAAFWKQNFRVTRAVLAPRAESEFLVEGALERLKDVSEPRLVDLGTGSGCLAVALLCERADATVLARDFSAEALTVAGLNAEDNSVADRFTADEGDWLEGVDESFNLIVSNPPYISRAEVDDLMPEVRGHDPRLALDGGEDGLEAYRRLIPQLSARLLPGGHAGLEVGLGQAALVAALGAGAGLEHETTVPDLAGIDRVVWLRRSI